MDVCIKIEQNLGINDILLPPVFSKLTDISDISISLTFLVSKMGLTTLVTQPVLILREKF